jgi:excisionase family DNA binding protein
MTRRRLRIDPSIISPSRRGEGPGEPAPHPVPAVGADSEPWLLDSRQVARLLGISRTKTFQMMATAELPTVRIGRCIRVPREGLLNWVMRQASLESAVRPESWIHKQRASPRPGIR